MDRSAALLNDANKDVFTYVAQLPYLGAAYDDLRETLEENNVPLTNKISSIFTLTTAMTDIGGTTGPPLPTDLIEFQGVYERTPGTTEDFTEVIKKEFLPKTSVKTQSFGVFSWIGQTIQFIGATGSREVQLNYVSNGMVDLVDQTTVIPLINGKNFLAYLNAGYCADFIGENEARATKLYGMAERSLGRLLNISAKGKQFIVTRHRPFRARFKVRTWT